MFFQDVHILNGIGIKIALLKHIKSNVFTLGRVGAGSNAALAVAASRAIGATLEVIVLYLSSKVISQCPRCRLNINDCVFQ